MGFLVIFYDEIMYFLSRLELWSSTNSKLKLRGSWRRRWRGIISGHVNINLEHLWRSASSQVTYDVNGKQLPWCQIFNESSSWPGLGIIGWDIVAIYLGITGLIIVTTYFGDRGMFTPTDFVLWSRGPPITTPFEIMGVDT